MPVVALNLIEAIALTNERVALENRTVGQIYAQFAIFDAAMLPIFSPLSVEQRIVRNWLVQSNQLLQQLAAEGAAAGAVGAFRRQQIIETVCRILYATSNAATISYITGAQSAAVLAAWNASLGLIP